MPKQFSTKNLTVDVPAAATQAGRGIFEFTEDYSVFDFGKMPDRIPGKGEAICRMTGFNFALLERAGVRTHFQRLILPNRIQFTLLRIINPHVTAIPPGTVNYLIPLQVKFRNSLPRGSSIFERLYSGQITLDELGLPAVPEPGARLAAPMIEFTTKLEETDRFITRAEARALAALSESQVLAIEETARKVNEIISEHAASVGLDHADGKIEFGLGPDGTLLLVDAVGTPDENRFLLDDFHLSKQVMRDFYARLDLKSTVKSWAQASLPREQWPAQPSLPREYVAVLADMYRSLCELWTGERVWDVPPLREVLRKLRKLS